MEHMALLPLELIGQGVGMSQCPSITPASPQEIDRNANFGSRPTKSETPGVGPSYLDTNVSERLLVKSSDNFGVMRSTPTLGVEIT